MYIRVYICICLCVVWFFLNKTFYTWYLLSFPAGKFNVSFLPPGGAARPPVHSESDRLTKWLLLGFAAKMRWTLSHSNVRERNSLKSKLLRVKVLQQWNHCNTLQSDGKYSAFPLQIVLLCWQWHIILSIFNLTYFLWTEGRNKGALFGHISSLSNRTSPGCKVISWISPPFQPYIWLAAPQVNNVCGATVGVHPFMVQIFDLSPLRLSLQSKLPPYEVIPNASFILITGCLSCLNRVFDLPNASFLHLVGRFGF